MTTLRINDLPTCRRLDLKAMAALRGGAAPWVFGWIRPFTGDLQSSAPVINFFQINNFNAAQMNNQFQEVNVANSAANSNVNVAVAAVANNALAAHAPPL